MIYKDIMGIYGIVTGTVFYESQTRISGIMRVSSIYGDSGLGHLKCGL